MALPIAPPGGAVEWWNDLFIRPASRPRGIGRQVTGRLAEIGRDRGCELAVWSVWTKNPAAKAFYERLGAGAIDDEELMILPI